MQVFIWVLLFAATGVSAEQLLIKNARVFNGTDAQLSKGHVLIEDGLIVSITAKLPPHNAIRVIDAQNRLLSPGFIDIHVHFAEQYPFKFDKYHSIVKGVYTGEALKFYLNSGFTAVRGAGGTPPELAKALASGDIVGPKLFASGAYIGQTSGHGDFRTAEQPNPILLRQSPYLNDGASILADGVDQVLTATRENLRLGATQIKIMGGGGVMSDYDPIHTMQYSPAEIRAAVQAASDWGTYVMAHAYTAPSIERLVNNGVKSIEHALLIDDKTARLVAEKQVVLSTQLYIFSGQQDVAKGASDTMLAKKRLVQSGLKNLISLIKKYQITTGFGTDFVFGGYSELGQEFVARAEYWSGFEILQQVTAENARIIRMAGPLVKGPKFGEIKPGWAADLVLLNGEPMQDIRILGDLQASVALVVKDGKVVADRM